MTVVRQNILSMIMLKNVKLSYGKVRFHLPYICRARNLCSYDPISVVFSNTFGKKWSLQVWAFSRRYITCQFSRSMVFEVETGIILKQFIQFQKLDQSFPLFSIQHKSFLHPIFNFSEKHFCYLKYNFSNLCAVSFIEKLANLQKFLFSPFKQY